MSYDVTIDYMGGSEWFNYTSNLSAFFAWALDTEHARPWGLNWLGNGYEGRLVVEAMPYLRTALQRIDDADHADLAAKYDAENGWGAVERATAFLWQVYRAMQEHPEGRIRVTA